MKESIDPRAAILTELRAAGHDQWPGPSPTDDPAFLPAVAELLARKNDSSAAAGLSIAQAALNDMRRYCFDRMPDRTIARAERLQSVLDAVSDVYGVEPGHSWNPAGMDEMRKRRIATLSAAAEEAEVLLSGMEDGSAASAVRDTVRLLLRAACASIRGEGDPEEPGTQKAAEGD